jgi:hypothetical protein
VYQDEPEVVPTCGGVYAIAGILADAVCAGCGGSGEVSAKRHARLTQPPIITLAESLYRENGGEQ